VKILVNVLWNVLLCNLVDLPTYRKSVLAQYLKMKSVCHFKIPLEVLNLEAACSFDKLLKLYHITRRHIPDEGNLHYMLYHSLSVY
jgi:hypothetical protein